MRTVQQTLLGRHRRVVFALSLVVMPLVTASGCSWMELSGYTGTAQDASTDLSDATMKSAPLTPLTPERDPAEPDAARPFSCDGGVHAFCEDFGDPNFLNHWTEPLVGRGAQLTRETGQYLSPPASLHAMVPASPLGTEARVWRSLSGVSGGMTLAFDVLSADVPSTATGRVALASVKVGMGVELAVVLTGKPTPRLNVEQAAPQDGSMFYGNVFSNGFLVPQAWTHVVIDFAFKAGGACTATVTVDQTPPQSAPTPRSAAVPGGTVVVALGFQHYSNAPFDAWGADFDNFVIDTR